MTNNTKQKIARVEISRFKAKLRLARAVVVDEVRMT